MDYNYKEMLESARATGTTSEKTMWASIESVNGLLCSIKKSHPDLYWKFMREQHGILFGNHYDEAFAMYDVAQLVYLSREGKEISGAHWTAAQVEEATKQLSFPSGTTKWDKYVAFNVMYSDACQDFEDEAILKMAYRFFFADKDWPTNTKIWEYLQLRSDQE